MKIGITYDLRQDYLEMGYNEEETAEFDKESTIEGIENAIKAIGYEPERIGNIKKLVNSLAIGKRWDLVFNISEGLYGSARESQVTALLDAYRIPYVFSDTLTLAVTLNKGLTKTIIKASGLPTPDFFVLDNIENIFKVNLPYPLFAKPIAEGTGKGITGSSKIMSFPQLKTVCEKLLDKYNQPVLIETFLPGEEYTIGIVGTGKDSKAVGALQILLNSNAEPDVYSYENKENYIDKVEYILSSSVNAQKCKELAIAAWKTLKCYDGGRIDIRLDAEGVPNFIEVNPLAGLNPETSDLPIMCKKAGIAYNDLISDIIKSALKRIKND